MSDDMSDKSLSAEIAIRVWDAIAGNRVPDPHDIEELRRLAPSAAGLPIDEVACEVLLRAMSTD